MLDKAILAADDFKIRLPQLAFDSLRRNFMLGSFRSVADRWLRFSVDDNQSASRNQRLLQVGENGMRICEFMIRIQNEDRVHASRQVRIRWIPMTISTLCSRLDIARARRNISGSLRMSSAITRPLPPTGDESFSVKYPEPHPRSTTTLPDLRSNAWRISDGRCQWSRSASTAFRRENVWSAE